MEAKIRRQRSNLFYSGLAVIIFGVWGALKYVIYYYMHPEYVEWKSVLESLPEDVSEKQILIITLITVALMDFIVRYIIGRGAIKESRLATSKRKNGYRVLAILYLISDVVGYIHAFRGAFAATNVEDMLTGFGINNLIMLVIEITSCWAMIELISASFLLRKYERSKEALI